MSKLSAAFGGFIEALLDVVIEEHGWTEANKAKFIMPGIMAIDEVTLAYLATKRYLQRAVPGTVVRKEQWVRKGRRCDVVLGDLKKGVDWLELKVWRDSRARKAIALDLQKLRDSVKSGMRLQQTYYKSVKLDVPDNVGRYAVVIRSSKRMLQNTDWSLGKRFGAVEPVAIHHAVKMPSRHVYIAIYDANTLPADDCEPAATG